MRYALIGLLALGISGGASAQISPQVTPGSVSGAGLPAVGYNFGHDPDPRIRASNQEEYQRLRRDRINRILAANPNAEVELRALPTREARIAYFRKLDKATPRY
ncbi:hypothetical protein [uncultured Sphingomonas sp.]|uniref:hypothetical protein n=1 Tax=uncultured Sphingomonas sp. TaxID=158754 RepID=UPI0025EDA0AA|nr:hypothetical protein [uncultured Sphingomonas sp.]